MSIWKLSLFLSRYYIIVIYFNPIFMEKRFCIFINFTETIFYSLGEVKKAEKLEIGLQIQPYFSSLCFSIQLLFMQIN